MCVPHLICFRVAKEQCTNVKDTCETEQVRGGALCQKWGSATHEANPRVGFSPGRSTSTLSLGSDQSCLYSTPSHANFTPRTAHLPFFLHSRACRISVLRQGSNLGLALKAPSPNPWTSRASPTSLYPSCSSLGPALDGTYFLATPGPKQRPFCCHPWEIPWGFVIK